MRQQADMVREIAAAASFLHSRVTQEVSDRKLDDWPVYP